MIRNFFWCCLLFLLYLNTISCKKESSLSKLGKLDLANGYALIVPEKQDNEIPNLYKLTENDTLQPTKYLTVDGIDMGQAYSPVSIYDLNGSYFYLTLSRVGQTPTLYESYLIQKSNGLATEVTPEMHPTLNGNGGTSDNLSPKAFRLANENNFYCLNNNDLFSLNLGTTNTVAVTKQTLTETLGSDFVADNDQTIYSNGKILAGNETYPISGFDSKTTNISKAYNHGYFMASMVDSSINIQQLTVENNALQTLFIKKVAKGNDTWNYIGSAIFTDYQCTVMVYDKGIVYISKDQTGCMKTSAFSLSTIDKMDFSGKYFYVTAINVLGKSAFMLMNPSTFPITFTQTLSPGAYQYSLLHATPDNVVTFFGVRSTDSREVFGYIPQNSNVIIKINHQHLKIRQIVAYK